MVFKIRQLFRERTQNKIARNIIVGLWEESWAVKVQDNGILSALLKLPSWERA
jgi:hypothetical protein